jgi:hypothetical protein
MRYLALKPLHRQVLHRIASGRADNRQDLATLLGVSLQTVTRAVHSLMGSGIIEETATRSGNRGQPLRTLIYRRQSIVALGLVISRNRLALSAEDLNGDILARRELTGDFHAPREALRGIGDLIHALDEQLPRDPAHVGLGVAAQGFFLDPGRRLVAKGDPRAWAGLDLRTELETLTGWPVTIHNDARAIAAGSLRDNVSASFSHYFCCYLGSGIGGGLVLDGAIYEGPTGNAGEIGALVPDDPFRPTTDNFMRVAGLGTLEDWPGLDALEPGRRDRITDWCRRAGERLSAPLQSLLALVEVQAILFHSRIPREIVALICQAIVLVPVGDELLVDSDLRGLLHRPQIRIMDDASLDRGACAVAVAEYFRT